MDERAKVMMLRGQAGCGAHDAMLLLRLCDGDEDRAMRFLRESEQPLVEALIAEVCKLRTKLTNKEE